MEKAGEWGAHAGGGCEVRSQSTPKGGGHSPENEPAPALEASRAGSGQAQPGSCQPRPPLGHFGRSRCPRPPGTLPVPPSGQCHMPLACSGRPRQLQTLPPRLLGKPRGAASSQNNLTPVPRHLGGRAQEPGAVSGTEPWAERGLGLGHGWGTGTGRDMETGRWPGKPRGGWGPAEAHGNAVQTGAEAETGALAPRTGRPRPLQRGASPGHRRPGQPPEGSGQLGG